MRILITGGAGFIGSHSADAARAAGHQVRVLDNLSTGHRANLPPAIDFVEGDVIVPDAVASAMAGCDAVLHLAALVSVPKSVREPVTTYTINTTGTATVLEAARQAGVRRVVFASTSAVYGDLPGRKTENDPCLPVAPYGASKLMAEEWLQVYARAYAMETASLRYFNVYGPRQRADSPYSGVLARWTAAIQAGEPCTVFGDGEQTRDFVSVHDVVAANLLALVSDRLNWGGVYNVATGASVSLNAILDGLSRATGRPVTRVYAAPRAGDIVHSACSSDRLQALGWRPQVDLVSGLAELLQPL